VIRLRACKNKWRDEATELLSPIVAHLKTHRNLGYDIKLISIRLRQLDPLPWELHHWTWKILIARKRLLLAVISTIKPSPSTGKMGRLD
jgi:hypothetical protein